MRNFSFLFSVFANHQLRQKGLEYDGIGPERSRGLQAPQPQTDFVLQLRGKPLRAIGKGLGRSVRASIRILATAHNGRDLSLSGLRRLAMRLRKGWKRQLRRRIFPAFSCKRRHFCPSCHRKRVVEYGEWLLTDVLKKVPHRHWVFKHTQTPPDLFHVRRLPARKTEQMRVERCERIFEIRSPPRRRRAGGEHGHTHPGRLSQLQFPCTRQNHRRLLSAGQFLCRRTGSARRRPRGTFPVRSFQDAEKRGQNQRRHNRKHALLAPHRVPRPCRRQDLARRRKRAGQPGQVHCKVRLLPGAHALHPRRKIVRRPGQGRLPVKGLKKPNKPSTL